MPEIKKCSDMKHSYPEISKYCNTYNEPVFITKNGKGDLAVMSMEKYEKLSGKWTLHNLLEESYNAIEKGLFLTEGEMQNEKGIYNNIFSHLHK